MLKLELMMWKWITIKTTTIFINWHSANTESVLMPLLADAIKCGERNLCEGHAKSFRIRPTTAKSQFKWIATTVVGRSSSNWQYFIWHNLSKIDFPISNMCNVCCYKITGQGKRWLCLLSFDSTKSYGQTLDAQTFIYLRVVRLFPFLTLHSHSFWIWKCARMFVWIKRKMHAITLLFWFR